MGEPVTYVLSNRGADQLRQPEDGLTGKVVQQARSTCAAHDNLPIDNYHTGHGLDGARELYSEDRPLAKQSKSPHIF